MPRFALKIEYDGAPFSGWQRQNDVPTVQGEIENALRRLDPALTFIQGAGRTDAGVHATGQVAHVDLVRDWPAAELMGAINYHVRPNPIAILDVANVSGEFHARFNAIERSYVYRLLNRRPPLTFDRGKFWKVHHPLDVAEMQRAANFLIGRHDFTTFRSVMCQAKSPVKTLDEITITELPYPHGTEYRFFVRAPSFLHNQVRSIVGTLERVGFHQWPAERVRDALAAADRTACGPVAPPEGLYLDTVRYPADPFSQK